MLQKINRKSLLYKSNVEYADYGLNHIEGCSHGCKFPCYAYMMKKRCGIVKSYSEWISPKIVGNAMELLNKELPKLKNKIHCVFLCFSSDPFMYKQPEVIKLTLEILEKLNTYGIRSTIITKGIYPKELINTNKYNSLNEYGSTIVSLSEEYRKKFEPGAAPIKKRIEALKKLHQDGLKTWVSMEPYPTPNIVKQDIKNILESISFVDKIVFGRWNYNSLISGQIGVKDFYNSMANYVIKFCKDRNIDVYIKDGTITQKILPSKDKELFSLNKYIEHNKFQPSETAIFKIA